MDDERDRWEMLTVGEVARRLRVGRSTAYWLCRRPDFPAARIGGVIRIPPDALDLWVARRLRFRQAAAEMGEAGKHEAGEGREEP